MVMSSFESIDRLHEHDLSTNPRAHVKKKTKSNTGKNEV